MDKLDLNVKDQRVMTKKQNVFFSSERSVNNLNVILYPKTANCTSLLHLLYDQHWCIDHQVVQDFDQMGMICDSFHYQHMPLHQTATD